MSPAAVAALPPWAEWLVAALVLGRRVGAAGTIGLLRLPTFFECGTHRPSSRRWPAGALCGFNAVLFDGKRRAALHAC